MRLNFFAFAWRHPWRGADRDHDGLIVELDGFGLHRLLLRKQRVRSVIECSIDLVVVGLFASDPTIQSLKPLEPALSSRRWLTQRTKDGGI